MDFVISPPSQPYLPVQGSTSVFPVHRIYCVGRNYAAHAIEMGGDPGGDPPFFFQKNADNLYLAETFPYPPASSDVHHEIELVVALGPKASIFGYAAGLDMTRRDLQGAAKKLGRPWEVAKAFDHSAPVSSIMSAANIGHPAKGTITLDVNGQRRQTGDIADMIWSVAEIIVELGQLFELRAGDVIFTGTPAGVGPVQRGDVLHGAIAGIATLDVKVI